MSIDYIKHLAQSQLHTEWTLVTYLLPLYLPEYVSMDQNNNYIDNKKILQLSSRNTLHVHNSYLSKLINIMYMLCFVVCLTLLASYLLLHLSNMCTCRRTLYIAINGVDFEIPVFGTYPSPYFACFFPPSESL